MTYAELKEILKRNNVPDNAILKSDSGWECSATHMDGVYYNKEKNIVVFTQDANEYQRNYIKENGWEMLL